MPIDLDISDAAITVVSRIRLTSRAVRFLAWSSIPWKDQANIGMELDRSIGF